MKFLVALVFTLLCLTGTLSDTSSTGEETTTVAATTVSNTHETETTISSLSPTTATDLPTTKSQPPTTTSDPPTTSSAAPTTSSSAAPTTSSAIPTTPSAAPSTSSAVPTTSSPVAPTSSPVPPTSTPATPTTDSPKPVPVEGTWNVTDGNVTCIRAELKVLFSIPTEGKTVYIALSPNASSASSDCRDLNGTQKLILQDSNYGLMMMFEKNSNEVFVRNITFVYNLPSGPDAVYNDTKLFTAKLGNSYLCRSTNKVSLGNVTMEVYEIQILAFGGEGNKDFGTADECEADDKVSDEVPIAVGCALAALIVIVIIAYLVGRRRSRQRGYQSV